MAAPLAPDPPPHAPPAETWDAGALAVLTAAWDAATVDHAARVRRGNAGGEQVATDDSGVRAYPPVSMGRIPMTE